jgi:predicted NAD/FAD-dependent oxidoreductase
VQQWDARVTEINHKTISPIVIQNHFVGTPSMNSICKHLALSDNIKRKFSFQSYIVRDTDKWRVQNELNVSDATEVYDFDYVISADRNSAKEGRMDLGAATTMDAIGPFVQLSRALIASRPALIAMITVNSPLPESLGDMITFKDDSILSLAVRDSSKPSRYRQTVD